jgi:hypothetical protein
MAVFRRRYFIIVLAVLCSSAILCWGWFQQTFQFRISTPLPLPEIVVGDSWNVERDSKNLLMNGAQCDAAFPDLYKEIDRAVAYRQDNHITLDEINKIEKVRGYTRALIFDQQV